MLLPIPPSSSSLERWKSIFWILLSSSYFDICQPSLFGKIFFKKQLKTHSSVFSVMMLNLRRTGLILSLKSHVLLVYRIVLQFLISVKISLFRKVWSEIEPSQKHAAGHSTTTMWLHPTFHTTSTFCWLQINLRNMLFHISHRVINFHFAIFFCWIPLMGIMLIRKSEGKDWSRMWWTACHILKGTPPHSSIWRG